MNNNTFQALKQFINDYKFDLLFYVILLILNECVLILPTHKEIPNPNDPNYLFPKQDDIISRSLNVIINFYIPIIIIGIIFILKEDYVGGLTTLIPFASGELIVGLIVQLLKRYAGKPRPFYNTYCIEHYKTSCNHNFPSGHTAYSFQSQLFMSLLLLEILSHYKYSHNLIVRVIIFIPCIWACFVGVSRYYDYHHGIIDIIVGGLIGSFVSLTTFCVYKNKIFKKKQLTEEELFAIEFE